MALNFDNKLSGQQRLTKADLFLMNEHVLHLFHLLINDIDIKVQTVCKKHVRY